MGKAPRGGIIFTPHQEGCYLAEQDRCEYIVHDGMEWNRDKLGRRYKDGCGGQTWHRFRCNDPDCDSVALVRWDVLMEFIARDGAA